MPAATPTGAPPGPAPALFAVLYCAAAVVGGPRVLLGGLCALPNDALALSGSSDDDLGAGDHVRTVVLLAGGVALCQREIAGVGSLVSHQCREITGARDLVTLVGGIQTRLGALLAPTGGGLADVTAELVRP